MEEYTENTLPITEKSRRWIFSDLARRGMLYALAFSLGIFMLYLAGSMPDPGFTDSFLFFLLRALRYTSLASGTFSLIAMGFSVNNLVHRPSLRSLRSLLLCFAVGILSASLAMLDLFIIAATEGNI